MLELGCMEQGALILTLEKNQQRSARAIEIVKTPSVHCRCCWPCGT